MSAHAEPRDAAAGALGPKLLAWWAHMSNNDAEAMRVAAEIRGGLEAWEKNERWAPLRHAGTRDTAERTLFDMILAGDIPSDKVYEDEVWPRPRARRPCIPLTTHHSPLTTHHSPLTTHHSPLTTHHSPLTTHHSPLTTHYSLLTTHYSLLRYGRCLASHTWPSQSPCSEIRCTAPRPPPTTRQDG